MKFEKEVFYTPEIKEEEIDKIHRAIEYILENPTSLGKGNAAEVFAFENETFCIKHITNDKRLFNYK